MRAIKILFFSVLFLSLTTVSHAKVLGACTTGDKKSSPPPKTKALNQPQQVVMPVPLPGQDAIDFELPAVVNNELKAIKLSDFNGKYRVLCFYPAAFTFVCPTELSAVAEKYKELKKLNVEVIAISTDSHFTQWMWKKTSPTIKNVDFPIAGDPSGAVSRAYGVYDPDSGLNQRGRFIISPEGRILAVEVITGPVGRNVDELIRQIKAMQAVEKNPGKATPAGWHPGDKFIDTDKDAIGKY